MSTFLGPGVRVVGKRFRPHFLLAIVADPDTGNEVEVRVDLARAKPYRCKAHGPQPVPQCQHTTLVHHLLVNRRRTS